MKISSLLLLAGIPAVYPWLLRWGPLNAQGVPMYLRSGSTTLEPCQDMRKQYANKPAKTPTPGYLLWLPNEGSKKAGCCLHIYGVDNDPGESVANHYCRRLQGGERYRNKFCDGKNRRVLLKASEGIGSYRVLCKP